MEGLMSKQLYVQLALLLMITAALAGCTNAGEFTQVGITEQFSAGDVSDSVGNRSLCSMWGIQFDTGRLAAEVTPIHGAQIHLNLTNVLLPPSCDDCLKIVVNQYNTETHIIDADVSIQHHFPQTGYDVRGILYTDNAGHTLTNADGWTGRFDIPGGDTINPFKSFAKSTPYRKFAPKGQYTEKYLVSLPESSQPGPVMFAVTTSWPGNCSEPYEIIDFQSDQIFEQPGSSGKISIDVMDWQLDVAKVTLSAPAITGEQYTQFVFAGGNTWTLNLTNNTGAKHGVYNCRVIATSFGAPNTPLFHYLPVRIFNKAYGIGLTWGGSDDDAGYGVATDSDGNIYVTGQFAGMVDFDPGPGVDLHQAAGVSDIFFSKFDHSGDLAWVRTWGSGDGDSTYNDCGFTIAVAGSDVYVGGMFTGTVDFFPGDMTEYHVSNGEADVFLCKYSTDGDFQWAHSWGGESDDWCVNVAVDGVGNVIAGGVFSAPEGSPVDLDPGEGYDKHPSNGKSDIYVSKYSNDGDYIWGLTWGSAINDSCDGICIDKSNNIYVCGFSGWADFDPGPDVDFLQEGSYLTKFYPDGTQFWTRTWGDNSTDAAGVAVDQAGNAYVTGDFMGYYDFDPGPGVDYHDADGGIHAYLTKFDPLGYFYWCSSWGGDYICATTDVSFGNGSVYASGTFNSEVDFDPGPGQEMHTTGYDDEGYISRFTANGDFEWVTLCGTVSPEDMSIGPFGGIHIAGILWGIVDLDPGPGAAEHVSNGYVDALLVRYTQDGDW